MFALIYLIARPKKKRIIQTYEYSGIKEHERKRVMFSSSNVKWTVWFVVDIVVAWFTLYDSKYVALLLIFV